MRYVLIVMLLFSSSAHAEDWTPMFKREQMEFYYGDVEFNPLNQTILVKLLIDNLPTKTRVSYVKHLQIQCTNQKPTSQRVFYKALYEGRMATGNVTFESEGAPWIPLETFALEDVLNVWCEKLWENRSR